MTVQYKFQVGDPVRAKRWFSVARKGVAGYPGVILDRFQGEAQLVYSVLVAHPEPLPPRIVYLMEDEMCTLEEEPPL